MGCCFTRNGSTNGEDPAEGRRLLSSESNNDSPPVTPVVTRVESANVEQFELTGKKWYRGNISNDDADRYLDEVSKGGDGSYIVYDNRKTKGQYILLVYYKGDKLRWKIQRCSNDGMYILGDEDPEVNRYKTVKELIKAHRGVMGKPIQTEKGGVVTLRKM